MGNRASRRTCAWLRTRACEYACRKTSVAVQKGAVWPGIGGCCVWCWLWGPMWSAGARTRTTAAAAVVTWHWLRPFRVLHSERLHCCTRLGLC